MNRNRHRELNSVQSSLVYIGGYALALLMSVIISFMPDGDVKSWLGYLVVQLGFMLAILIYFGFNVRDMACILPIGKRISPLGLLLTVPVTIGIFLQNTLPATGFVKLLSLFGITATVELPTPDNALNVLMGILCVCIAPAIGEEFMFRGVLLGAYRNKGGTLAVVLSALVFALGHFNLAQVVHQFILGLVLAYIVVATENIWYAVAVHLCNNILALFLTLIPEYNALAIFDGKSAIIMAIMCVVGIAILYPSLYGFAKIAATERLGREDRWIFHIFFKRKDRAPEDLWVRPPLGEGDKRKPDIWLIVFIGILIVVSIFSAILAATVS